MVVLELLPADDSDGRRQLIQQYVMEKDGDLDTFLRAFEKACRQYRLPTDEWARYLTPGLRGKALEAFAALPQEQDGDYEATKQALVTKYQLTPEVYRRKFRNLQRGPHDRYGDVVHELRTHFHQWIQGLSVTTFKQLEDLMIKEQFLHLCPAEVRQFVMYQEPKDVTKAAQIADAYEAKDTGAERILIQPELAAPEEIIPGKTLTVTGIGGISCPLPMARVYIDWGAGSGVKEVGLSDNLPTDVLLGTDLGRMVAYYVPDTPPQSANKGNVNPDDDNDDDDK
ncbi:uncharacterized protein LOC143788177 [Ranitomeya variabilis]|uniref:uncharacterized protein LOC143788177 n=1 Tax=Ranitomeya variabilis TaxID=490064 RepID=UPI0040574C74